MKAKSERRRPFIGNQLEECRDASGLFYILPFQKVSVICLFFSSIKKLINVILDNIVLNYY